MQDSIITEKKKYLFGFYRKYDRKEIFYTVNTCSFEETVLIHTKYTITS